MDKPLLDQYEELENYTKTVELSILEQKVLINYIKRLDSINKMELGAPIFNDSA